MAPEMLQIKSVPALNVYREIADRIARGEYPAGTWLPAERALAEEFEVDRPIVRNALTHLAKEGIIVTQRGKRPWVNVSRLTSNEDAMPPATSARKIAAILPQSPHYPAASAIMHGVSRTARTLATPPQVVMFNTSGSAAVDGADHELRALRSVLEEGFHAVLLWWQGGMKTMPLIQECQSQGIAIVFVDRCPEDFACDFVGSDNELGVDQAMEYLSSLGHTRIAHLTTYEEATPVRDRCHEYHAYLKSEGIQAPDEWTFRLPDTSSASFLEAITQWRELAEPPTAVFAMNDLLAHLLIAELDQMGMSVPETLSVVGFDDLEQFSPRPALLTTIHQPFDRIGKRAMTLIARRLEAGAPLQSPQQILLPTSLIKRMTCRLADA